MSTHALEVALALLARPDMRAALRQRPLPDGVGDVIDLASGSRERLAIAASLTSEPEERVLEAARFYVREVLLFDGADAYRVLGAGRGAPHALLKQRHRALQHWLHPDRFGNQWDSVFATRVNTAWTELRSAESRAAYDARLEATRHADAAEARRVLVPGWRAAADERPRWGSWLALGLAGISCVWLYTLVERQAQAPVPLWDDVVASADVVAVAPPPMPVEPLPIARPTPRRLMVPSPEVAIAVVPPTSPLPAPSATAALLQTGRPALAPPPPAKVVAATRPSSGPDPKTKTAQAERTRPAARRPSVPAASTPEAQLASVAPALPIVRADPPPVLEVPTPRHVELAHQRGKQLLQYLRRDSAQAPPIWRTSSALDSATAIHDHLTKARVRFGEPEWRISARQASLTVPVQRRGDPPGRLRARLSLRDDVWWVDTVALETQ